jgi:hypothetical protein
MKFVATVTHEILWGKLAQENVSFYPKSYKPYPKIGLIRPNSKHSS